MEQPLDVKALRDRFGWNQQQLADYLGLDRSAISRMENGQKPKGPTLALLKQLADREAAQPSEAAA